jgi:hypothetical protein
MTRYDWVPSALGRGVGGGLTGIVMTNRMVILASLGWSFPNRQCSRTDAAYATRMYDATQKDKRESRIFYYAVFSLKKAAREQSKSGDRAGLRLRIWTTPRYLEERHLHWQAVTAACRERACGGPSGLERSAGPWFISTVSLHRMTSPGRFGRIHRKVRNEPHKTRQRTAVCG